MNRINLVSGIRATGQLHVGNYMGAMKGLIKLQHQYQAHFFIADLHSLTTHPEAAQLQGKVMKAAKDYIAAGLDPERCTFYAQSSLAQEISELHLYLSMVMPLGDLLRCPTFKEKAKKHPDHVNYGLVGYPVLMAADILIHQGEVVPVGHDQLVHLELARTMARRFNQMYGEMFPEPQPIKENAVRIPSLQGQGKMSKSDAQESYIGLQEDQASIEAKVKKAYSDPDRVYKHQPGHPTVEGCNVYHLHSYFTSKSEVEEIERLCREAKIGCVTCKQHLAESFHSILEPFRRKRERITDADVAEILSYGSQKAKESCQKVMAEVRRRIGLVMF